MDPTPPLRPPHRPPCRRHCRPPTDPSTHSPWTPVSSPKDLPWTSLQTPLQTLPWEERLLWSLGLLLAQQRLHGGWPESPHAPWTAALHMPGSGYPAGGDTDPRGLSSLPVSVPTEISTRHTSFNTRGAMVFYYNFLSLNGPATVCLTTPVPEPTWHLPVSTELSGTESPGREGSTERRTKKQGIRGVVRVGPTLQPVSPPVPSPRKAAQGVCSGQHVIKGSAPRSHPPR